MEVKEDVKMILEERYEGDTAFRSLVDLLEAQIRQARYSAAELHEAVTLAVHHVDQHAGLLSREMSARLEMIEATLKILVDQRTVKDWYTTEEFAQMVGRAEFTVKGWCCRGRLNARKRSSGSGSHASWVISHEELLRFQREGLLSKNTANRATLRRGPESQAG